MNQNTTQNASEDARPDVACSATLGREIVYTVSSGGMVQEIRAEVPMKPMMIAALAIERAQPRSLGLLLEVQGGEYVGGNTTYVSVTHVLREMGHATEPAA